MKLVIVESPAKCKKINSFLGKNYIVKACTQWHVPAKVIQVEDIPYTLNGKKVELAVKNVLEGKDVNNKDALSNPKSLEFYKNIKIL